VKQTLTQRFFNVFRSGNQADTKAQQLLQEVVTDQRRSQIYPYQTQYHIIEPEWDYPALVKWANYNSVLRTIHEAIIQRATQKKGIIQPRWLRKCPSCGNEFQSVVEYCPNCQHGNGRQVATIEPDIDQRQLLQAFIEDPNSTDEINDIRVSGFRYMLAVSDWYISIQKADIESLSPITIYVEDSRYMRVCTNTHGKLGNGEYFCPKDTMAYPQEVYLKGGRCNHCGNTDLKETAYIYTDGQIKARWAKDQMLHKPLDANLPSVYGLSREISLLKALGVIDAMDEFNYTNYSEGKLGNIIVFEGLNQSDVNDLALKAKAQQNKPEVDPNTGRRFIKKLKTLLLGAGGKGGVTNIPAMPDSEKMQSLDWWKLMREMACSTYGVQDVAAGAMQPGTTGQNPRMKVDINNDVIETYLHAWHDPFNNVIVKEALGVTDWIYAPDALEEKDEAQEQAILQAKLNNIKLAIDLGMKAELSDEQEVKVSGEPLTLQQKQQQAMEQMQKQAEISNANAPQAPFDGNQPFKKENVFANEKGKKKWTVIEEQVKME